MAAVALFFSAAAQGAQFQFGALVQAGIAGTGDWEIGIGTTAAAPASTASLATQWANNTPRLVELEYLKSTNSVNVRVYDGNTNAGGFTQTSYSPAGGTLVGANAVWTLPASSFFVQATNGTILPSSITVSNITLSGISGAVNIIQPLQQTTLAANHSFLGATATTAQTGDVVFQADVNGNWRMTATVTMTGLFGAFGASGNELALALNANALDPVPEPGTLGLLLIGGAIIVGGRIRRNKSTGSPA